MFSGDLYEYKCSTCGNYGTAMVNLCRCEYCGAVVSGKVIEKETEIAKDKE
ncbi:hypothetical protein [Vallitalea guaymasensis]|uniref:hypothetical protein n=1 Tax=Vallitalea guaymasensis TaxID=1185412 RepID=UPI00187D4F1B|nr:hypothetical protein [Vallitalea guaymasensis]